jgi:hypothetical protein
MCGHHDRCATKLPVAYARTGHKRVPAAAALRQSALRVLRAANRRGCGRRHHRIRLGRETMVERRRLGGEHSARERAQATEDHRLFGAAKHVAHRDWLQPRLSATTLGRGAGGGPAAPYFLNRSARCARSPVHGTPGLALGPAARHDARVRFSTERHGHLARSAADRRARTRRIARRARRRDDDSWCTSGAGPRAGGPSEGIAHATRARARGRCTIRVAPPGAGDLCRWFDFGHS